MGGKTLLKNHSGGFSPGVMCFALYIIQLHTAHAIIIGVNWKSKEVGVRPCANMTNRVHFKSNDIGYSIFPHAKYTTVLIPHDWSISFPMYYKYLYDINVARVHSYQNNFKKTRRDLKMIVYPERVFKAGA